MKNMPRTIITGLAFLLIFFGIREWLSGDRIDYISLGIGIATLIYILLTRKKNQDGSP